jgi:hypothetical protein
MSRSSPATNPVADLEASIARQIQAQLAIMQTALAETVGGQLLRGARPVAVSSSKNRPTRSAAALVGFSFRETTGLANALVYLREGENVTGDIIAVISLAPGESVRDWFGPGGINVGDRGLYVDVASGAIDGAVYLRGAD